MARADQKRLDVLLQRMIYLERLQVPEHERAIREVALAWLRDEICVLAHSMHDGDYCRGGNRDAREAG